LIVAVGELIITIFVVCLVPWPLTRLSFPRQFRGLEKYIDNIELLFYLLIPMRLARYNIYTGI